MVIFEKITPQISCLVFYVDQLIGRVPKKSKNDYLHVVMKRKVKHTYGQIINDENE